MKISTLGLVEMASHEGICQRPYRDSVGVLTFGIGHTKSAGNPDPASLPRDLDQPLSMVFEVFRRDLAMFEAAVNRLVKVPLAQHQFDALVSFHFNTGGLGRSQLLISLNAGDYDGAARGFMGWLKPPEIKGRRTKERDLFRDGTYTAKGFATVFPVERERVQWAKGKRVNVLELLQATGSPVEPRPVPTPPTTASRPPSPPLPRPAPPAPAQKPKSFFTIISEFLAAMFGGRK